MLIVHAFLNQLEILYIQERSKVKLLIVREINQKSIMYPIKKQPPIQNTHTKELHDCNCYRILFTYDYSEITPQFQGC